MITDLLTDIQNYLTANLKALDDSYAVKLKALAKDDSNAEEEAILTLLRIEEETSLKQQVAYRPAKDDSGQKVKTNPDLWINLYIMISSHVKYDTSLKIIEKVMVAMNSIDADVENKYPYLKDISVNLENLSAEQYNSLWQTLGCSLVPAVVFKLRMVKITSTSEEKVKIIGINQQNEEVDDPIKLNADPETVFDTVPLLALEYLKGEKDFIPNDDMSEEEKTALEHEKESLKLLLQEWKALYDAGTPLSKKRLKVLRKGIEDKMLDETIADKQRYIIYSLNY